MTAAELLHLRIPNEVTELVRGRLVVRDLFSTRHGLVTAALVYSVSLFLEAGTRIVWVIDPLRDTARIHRADGSIEDLGLDDTLYGDHILCGFTVPLRELLN